MGTHIDTHEPDASNPWLSPVIWTHEQLDADAYLSVLMARRYWLGEGTHINVAPANWDGAEILPGDVAIDIRAGGKGIKGREGPDGEVYSSFAVILEKCPPEIRVALQYLVTYIDVLDAFGSPVAHFLGDVAAGDITEETYWTFRETSFCAVLRALQKRFANDHEEILERLEPIVEGMIALGSPEEAEELTASDLSAILVEWVIRTYGADPGGVLPEGLILEDYSFDWVLETFAPPETKEALQYLLAYLSVFDTDEVQGDAYRVIRETGFCAILRALRAIYGDDNDAILQSLDPILQGMIAMWPSRVLAFEEAEDAEILEGGLVALVKNARGYGTNEVVALRHQSIGAIVWVDGNNLGVQRVNRRVRPRVSLYHPDLLRLAQDAQEDALNETNGTEWFVHSGKWLFARGTRKAPAKTPSKVDPNDLAKVVADILRSAWGEQSNP